MIDLETYLEALLTKLYGRKKMIWIDFSHLNHKQETKRIQHVCAL